MVIFHLLFTLFCLPPCNKSQTERSSIPKCFAVLICMRENKCPTTFLLHLFPRFLRLLWLSPSLLLCCCLRAVKCLEAVSAVTQRVGNWRRWVKEGDEFIKPRTTSQFILIYHLTPHLSRAVLLCTHTWPDVCVGTCVAARADTHGDVLASSLSHSLSLSVLRYRQTGAAAVAGLT